MAGTDDAKRIQELTERIAQLEETIRQVSVPYSQLVSQLATFQETVGKYFRLMDLYQRYGVVSVDTIVPEVKDPISKDILRILLDRPGLNISQLTDELKGRRGSSSRRIVRDKLGELAKAGLLVEEAGRNERSYRLSEDLVKRWSQVLGLTK
ncbi:MAG: ArsR family transcriptional regulator [Euryarchaeota archaeon]|nr:ArsR family transcriptional regulator [Euryarchaeota archaeon]